MSHARGIDKTVKIFPHSLFMGLCNESLCRMKYDYILHQGGVPLDLASSSNDILSGYTFADDGSMVTDLRYFVLQIRQPFHITDIGSIEYISLITIYSTNELTVTLWYVKLWYMIQVYSSSQSTLCHSHCLLTRWGRNKIDAILQMTFSNAISWMKMFEFRLKFHWSLFLKVQLTIFQHWFR